MTGIYALKIDGKIARTTSAWFRECPAVEDWSSMLFICEDREYEVVLLKRQEDMEAPMNKWTSDWPTEPGYYWFYGHCFEFSSRYYEAETHLVKVSQGGNCLACVTDGHFLYESEAEGVWMHADIPSPQEAT